MISTRVFSRHASIWGVLTPTLEPVVRWLNTHQDVYTNPVSATGGDPGHNSVISESAFLLARSDFRLRLPSTSASGLLADNYVAAAIDQGRSFLSSMPDDRSLPDFLDNDEVLEIVNLAFSLRQFTRRLGNPEYYPLVPGCGVVDRAHADIRDGSSLIEVKMVTRKFRGMDVRQILTYSAMFYASGYDVETVVFVNPRRGYFASASLDFIAYGSSGRGRAELLYEISQAMSDLQVSG
jgi:hypothetical protein